MGNKSKIQISNLTILEKFWVELSARQVSIHLSSFREWVKPGQEECRTIACIGGHAALMPEFQEQGLGFESGFLTLNETAEHHENISLRLLGDARMFAPIGWHPADRPIAEQYRSEAEKLRGYIGNWSPWLTREQTHAIALVRIRSALASPYVRYER